jgi:hypothetical protein
MLVIAATTQPHTGLAPGMILGLEGAQLSGVRVAYISEPWIAQL